MFGAVYFGEVAFAQTEVQTASVATFVVLSPDPAMSNFTVGDHLALTAFFVATATDSPVDPTSVAFTIHAPNGVLTSPTPTRSGTGVYTLTQTLTTAGLWTWTAIGTGAAPASATGEFWVGS